VHRTALLLAAALAAATGCRGPASDGAADAGSGCPAIEGPVYPCPEPCQLASATAGSIVELEGLDPLGAPAPPLTRTERDRVLLFSDSPEEPQQAGVLARAELPAGPVRLYLYHLNASPTDKKMVVVLENRGQAAAQVDIERFEVASPDSNFLAVGKATTAGFLIADNPAIKSVPAGGAAHLLTTLDDTAIAPGALGHAIIDAQLSAPLTAHVIFTDPADDALASFDTLAPLPLDADHQRGTFRGADRELALAGGCPLASEGGVVRLRLGHDTELAPVPAGTDEITGTAQELLGHYGFVYRIETPIAGTSAGFAVLLMARGGVFAGAARVSGGELGDRVVELPSSALAIDDPTRALLVDRVPAGGTWTMIWTAPGASNLPIDLLWVPLEP
jgi:hypothetical protein